MRRLLPFWVLCLVVVGVATGGASGDEKPKGKAKPAVARPGVPDAELQKRINEAISRGAAWLRSVEKDNGAFGGLHARGEMTHEVGVTALMGLALLASGDRRGDASVDKVYEYVKTRDALLGPAGSRATYDTGVLLMFITRYWQGEEDDKHAGPGTTRPGHKAHNPCNLPPEVQTWVQELADWLVRLRKPETSTWGYPAYRDDMSNSQYAYLGLRAARDCGAHVPAAVFLRGIQTALERQEKEGPKVMRILPSPDPGASPYAIDSGDRARGWSYLMEPYVPSGSMTTSGIGLLAIANDALLRPKRWDGYTTQIEHAVQRAAQDGFAWLDKNWTVERNPGASAANWHYYFLYGLERAAVLGGRDLIGRHDWYVEGATHLVGKQAADGHWSTGMLGQSDYEASDLVDTAWALLFLARATRPAPPLPAPVVTEGD